MDREYFIFYRSFYEAIKCMNEKVQLQIFTAVAEYALDGTEPSNLCKEAQGMFLLMRPVIDANNTRFKNGKLGGRPRKKPSSDSEDPYSATFETETEKMKTEDIWLEGISKNFNVDKDEILRRLDRFAIHCSTECSDKPHSSLADAKKHFCAWMRKAYKNLDPQPEFQEDVPPVDYTFNGGFNSIDV